MDPAERPEPVEPERNSDEWIEAADKAACDAVDTNLFGFIDIIEGRRGTIEATFFIDCYKENLAAELAKRAK